MSSATFSVAFAHSEVDICYDSEEALDFLSLLFGDVSTGEIRARQPQRFSLRLDEDGHNYQLYDEDTLIFTGGLDVRFAAHLYDTVIFHLLNGARDGIALHTGAVVCNGKTILLPGLSGAGKSTLTAWLVSRDCTYLTDELIFLSMASPCSLAYYTRPLCLKPGSLHLLDELLHAPHTSELLIDKYGAVIPHRLINTSEPMSSAPLTAVILPEYRPDTDPLLEPISTARLATLLMGCHVNARNLVDHGFKEILEIARTTTAHRLRYGSLRNAGQLVDSILYD